MSYDRHVDQALIRNSEIWRTDVSFTLFLNSPQEYEGGELVIESADEEKAYKLDSGCDLFKVATATRCEIYFSWCILPYLFENYKHYCL